MHRHRQKQVKSQTAPISSDPPQHAGDPPVARHDNLTDDPASLVVVRPRVEAPQRLVVAAAVAVAAAAVLAAVAAVVQTVIQLDSDVSLRRTNTGADGVTITHMTNASPPEGKDRRGRRGGGRQGGGGGGGVN